MDNLENYDFNYYSHVSNSYETSYPYDYYDFDDAHSLSKPEQNFKNFEINEKNEHIFRFENYSVYDDEVFEEKEKEKEDIKIIDENDLKDKKYISQGSFGVVHRYTYKKNNIEKYVAVKKEL
jgi:hypothetical protein